MDSNFPCNNKCKFFTRCRNEIIREVNRLVRVRCRPEMFSTMARYEVYELIEEELYGNCETLRKAFDKDDDVTSKNLVNFIEPHIPTQVPPEEWRHFLELEPEEPTNWRQIEK